MQSANTWVPANISIFLTKHRAENKKKHAKAKRFVPTSIPNYYFKIWFTFSLIKYTYAQQNPLYERANEISTAILPYFP